MALFIGLFLSLEVCISFNTPFANQTAKGYKFLEKICNHLKREQNRPFPLKEQAASPVGVEEPHLPSFSIAI